ncbi:BUD13 homolog [Drosophila kikkawai]|uniref:BUD13 homolog n=1 Tax=Drosophila kikkawai TaxID=30033 RepID=A0A6P4HX84_DROKI|nr:BUD13 homolog [Drosophila kikkawai]
MSMQKAKIIDQKEYLKKYLSGDKEKKKKKKEKKHKKGTKVKIIDDDAYDEDNREMDEDLLLGGEDAPQIVGEYIEDDPNVRSKWRNIAVKDEIKEELGAESSPASAPAIRIKQEPLDEESGMWGRKATSTKIKDEFSPSRRNPPVKIKQEKRSSSRDLSPVRSPTRRGGSPDQSPPRQRVPDKSPQRRKRRDSDQSPPRRRRDAEKSPQRRSRRDSDQSSPRRGREADQSPQRRKRRNSDQSPPRRGRDVDQSPQRIKRRDSDQSPPRRERNGDQTPPRRQRDAVQSPARRRKDSDQSPPRKRRDKVQSPPRKRRDSDQSPPRRTKGDSVQSPPRRRKDRDSSPPRRQKDSDLSPPRRRKAQSPPRKREKDADQSPPRRRRDDDHSPPRRRRSVSRDRKPYREHNPFKKEEGRERKSRWAKNSASKSPSPPPTHKPKSTKTLDGKKAGLQDAQALKKETDERRKREHDLFEQMSTEVSGRDAEIQMRNTGRKGRRARDAANEDPAERRRKEEHEQKKKELYDKWGKGLKQIEDQKTRLEEMAHEAAKPVARYANDEDLDRHLREQEHADDPMLEYMRQKRKKKEEKSNKPVMPKYEGSYPENRFGIRPGYRWDGVDRSNGYEKRWFDKQNERKAVQDEAYKYSVEDM